MDRKNLILHIEENGKDRSWYELAVLYNIKPGYSRGQRAKAANDVWRRRNKKDKSFRFSDRAVVQTEGDIRRKKRWQLPDGTWRESVQFDFSKDNQKKQLEDIRDTILDEIRKHSPKQEKVSYKSSNEGILYEISLPDMHLGKITGETLKEQERLFIDGMKALHQKASALKIDRFLLPVGNDILNSEGVRQTTTKGTPQHDMCDWQTSFSTAWRMIVKSVDYLTQYAPVDIVVVSGNHDYETVYHIGDVLLAYYHNNPNVTVDNTPEPRKYYKYGVNLIGFTHGDCEKPHELPLIMATERPVDFSQSKHREFHLGHLHKHMVDEFRGVMVRFLPSLCGNDEWHKKMGYEAKRVAQAYIWSKTRGMEGYLQHNPFA